MLPALLALAFLALIAAGLRRGRGIDPRPVVTHPRWPFVALAAAAGALSFVDDLFVFLLACALLGAAAALLCERFRLTSEGIECRGAVLAWRTLTLRRTRLFLDIRTTRGQHLRLPRWMDGLGTLAWMASGCRLQEWRTPGASWS
jgi:hypothetical protein